MRVLKSQVQLEVLKIGVVISKFNREVTEKLENGALETLKQAGVKQIFLAHVPGAIEIPLVTKELIAQGCDGVVALGCVIRGETSHYELVCNTVERGCLSLQLETGIPVGMGVLTTETSLQALERAGGKKGHKGSEAASVTLEMIGLVQSINKYMKVNEDKYKIGDYGRR